MRDYDSTLGRYIEADPIGFAGGLDLYGYAAQDPLYWVDPSGEWIQAIIAGAVAACRAVCAPVAKAVRAARAALLARQAKNQQPKAPSNAAKAETKGGDAGVCKPAENTTVKPPKNPDDLLQQGYKETSTPEAAKVGHRTFENSQTGDKLRFDQGKLGKPGFEGKDHYHRYNPNATGKHDMYLDKNGNPCARGCRASHLPIED